MHVCSVSVLARFINIDFHVGIIEMILNNFVCMILVISSYMEIFFIIYLQNVYVALTEIQQCEQFNKQTNKTILTLYIRKGIHNIVYIHSFDDGLRILLSRPNSFSGVS